MDRLYNRSRRVDCSWHYVLHQALDVWELGGFNEHVLEGWLLDSGNQRVVELGFL